MRCAGYEWIRPTDMDADWTTTIGRCIASTWQFGSIHQCKIFIKYDHRIDGKKHKLNSYTIGDDLVAVCLSAPKTRQEAMKKMVAWIEKFQKSGPFTAAQTMKLCFKYYGDLYPNRVALLDHIFFVIGNGYDWLDGAVVSNSPDGHLESKEADKVFKKMKTQMKRDRAEIDKLLAQIDIIRETETDTLDAFRNQYWTTGTYAFYPVSEGYSLICEVPDDVRPDWLALAYEAALLLRDHSGIPDIKSKWNMGPKSDVKRQEDNRKIGARVVADLERRFPQLKDHNDVQVSAQKAR